MAAIDTILLRQLGSALLKDLKKRTPKASGETAKAARMEVKGGVMTIFVPEYYTALLYGRGPSKRKGSGETLEKRLLKWIRTMGITPKPDKKGRMITQETLAFLIARKIHREGTMRYRLKREANFLKGWVTKDLLKKFESKLIEERQPEIASDIIKKFKEAAK